MSKAPLIHNLSNRKPIPNELLNNYKVIYDPLTQKSNFSMGGQSTSCSKGTDGTEPKNEADQVMDD
ncbi:MAG: hypothetical protein CMC62_00715 [Flavobacteriaceae bacterium]|nr:hypothetical protein [Flavobacteriaceae bacterium]|tara:strand:+ start:4441 stop:4638 length:198 start_codon:yes stop_codon:yes gene_type:complete